jgi:parallel beta-helix repeat protein
VPIIERSLLFNSSAKDISHSSQVLVVAFILVTVLILGATGGLMAPIASNEVQRSSETTVRIPAGTLYSTHSPISIVGNAGFTNASGVSAGSGTVYDPYIISGWEITASFAPGIAINGTNAYFVIRNCQIHDGSPPNATLDHPGIALIDCTNGILENNTCFSCSVGISLLSSSNNTLSDNNCSGNAVNGIQLYSSSNNILRDNNCSNERAVFLWFSDNNTLEYNYFSDNWGGVFLEYSNNNTIFRNNCSDHGGGIDLIYSSGNNCTSNAVSEITIYDSRNCTLSSNIMIDTGVSIEGESLPYWNTHLISADNLVDGRPVYFYNNQNGFIVPTDAGQVILSNCTDFTVENQNMSYLSTGIEVGFSSNGNIRNNNCSSSINEGIGLQYSNDVTLSNNSLSNCIYGVSIISSCNITMQDNDCSNSWDGIYLIYSNDNSVCNSNCSSCYVGIWVDSSGNSTLSNNDCSNESEVGIEFWNSRNSTISGNNCSYNGGYGMRIEGSGNVIMANNCSNNAYDGMALWDSIDSVVMGNQFRDNVGYGTSISSSLFNVISNNVFSGNNGAGTTYDPAHVQAYDDRTNNSWNSSDGYGNYWSDWNAPDANHDGIVDQPYALDGSAGAQDNFPLTTVQTEIPEFGMTLFVVITLMTMIVLAGETRGKKKQ